MACKVFDDAENNIRSKGCIFVRPSDQGKTHTAHILGRDRGAFIIPSMTVSKQKLWFSKRLEKPLFILDDPSDWYKRSDLEHLFSVLKNLLTGWLKAGRASKFEENIPKPINKKVGVLIFCNEEQYDSIRMIAEKTGLEARCKTFLCMHEDTMIKKIEKEYAAYGYSAQNLPRFKLNGNTEFEDSFLESHQYGAYFYEEIEFEEVEQ